MRVRARLSASAVLFLMTGVAVALHHPSAGAPAAAADAHAKHVMPRAVPVAVTTAAPLPRTGWTAAADTAASGFDAAKALDDNTATAWKSTTTAMPHTITIDTHNRVALSGLTYLPLTGAN